MTSEYAVNRDRWNRLSILEQMGNIGSEVGRALNAKHAGREQDCQQAMVRALDLFDATVQPLIHQRSPRAKEVLRSRDQFLEAISDDTDPSRLAAIDRYFLQFATAARHGR